jgi:hypothetical protein
MSSLLRIVLYREAFSRNEPKRKAELEKGNGRSGRY